MTDGDDADRLAETLAALELDGLDHDILDTVRDHFAEVDPPPDGLVGRIQFALTLDRLQAEAEQAADGPSADPGEAQQPD